MSEATQSSFDVGVLEDLVQPVGLAWAVLDLGLAITRQVAERADRFGRHEARTQQPRLGQLRKPRRVRDVRLAPGDLLDVTRVAQHALKGVLEDRPDRLPVDPGCLHRHVRDAVRAQPIAQRQQPRDRRLELRDLQQPAVIRRRDANRRRDLRLVHIEPRDPLVDLIEHLRQHLRHHCLPSDVIE